MPRTYLKKKSEKYKKEDVEKAVHIFLNQPRGTISIKEVADQFNIPRKTLSDHVSAARNVKPMKIGAGRPTCIPYTMEEYLAHGIISAAELGWPLNRSDIKMTVRSYCMRMNITSHKDNFPGDDWMSLFAQRWKKKLSIRAAETLTKQRAAGLTKDVRDAFFTGFETKLTELGIKDMRNRIFNLDETGLSTKRSTKGFFFKRGSKEAQVIAPTEGKTMFTVMFCCNGCGDFLPPYIIYKGSPSCIQSTWVSGAPEGTAFNVTKSGWMEDYVFESWFKSKFVPWLDTKQVQRPVVLIFDGHGSHLTYNTVQVAQENGVCVYCLPPHTSSKLQPLDVGVYGPVKTVWKNILKTYYAESRQINVSKATFPTLLTKLFTDMCNRPGNVVNAFASCGLCPVKKEAITEEMMVITLPYAEPTRQTDPGEGTSQQTTPVPSVSPNPSPHKAMRQAIVNAISPQQSKVTQQALTLGGKRRKRIQKKIGECLTEPEAIERLRQEEEERKNKKLKTSRKGKVTKGQPIKNRKKKIVNYDSSDDDDSDDILLCDIAERKKQKKQHQEDEHDNEKDHEKDEEHHEIDEEDNDHKKDEEDLALLQPVNITLDMQNKYVAAVYDNAWYLALVEKQDKEMEELGLSFMHPPGPKTLFYWPKQQDSCTLPVKAILGILSVIPEPTTNRATHFKITTEMMDEIDSKFASTL